MKFYPFILCYLFFTSINSQNIELELFTSGLDKPVNMKNAGDGRLFVVEQDGTIRIVNSDGSLIPAPFLNINDRVINIGGIGDERGLLGLAFHPQYNTNGYFFVNYINNSGDTVISRFTRSNTNSANSNSELILLTINQLFSNHNGGDLAFGPDGYLYIATGDGGSGEDPQNQGQQLNTLLGKLLRIDVDNTENGNNYAIPSNNPFISNTAALNEIWAYGLRNPWKFSFDKETNDLWIADVGQYEYEEINMVPSDAAGLNYGWRCYEGNNVFNTSNCPDTNTLTFPIDEYSHFNDGMFKCSITGGYRYRGTTFTSMTGLYFFGDYCSDEIGYLQQNGNNWNMTLLPQNGTNGWTTFGEDINGELYVGGIVSGNIYKIIDSSLGLEENQLTNVKMYPNPTHSILNFDLGNTIMSSISILDIQGKLIKQFKPKTNKIKISVSDLNNGMYIVEIESVSGAKTNKKLIIN